MASVIWVGGACPDALWIRCGSLPVRDWILDRPRPPAPDDGRRIWPADALGGPELRILRGRDLYLLGVDDTAAVERVLRWFRPAAAVGGSRPPSGFRRADAAPEDWFGALLAELPPVLPAALYLRGGTVRSSITDGDFDALLERF